MMQSTDAERLSSKWDIIAFYNIMLRMQLWETGGL